MKFINSMIFVAAFGCALGFVTTEASAKGRHGHHGSRHHSQRHHHPSTTKISIHYHETKQPKSVDQKPSRVVDQKIKLFPALCKDGKIEYGLDPKVVCQLHKGFNKWM